MSNKSMKFPNDAPPGIVHLYWSREDRQWHIWFGESPPMFDDAEYTSFTEATFCYKLSEVPNRVKDLYKLETKMDQSSLVLKSGETGD